MSGYRQTEFIQEGKEMKKNNLLSLRDQLQADVTRLKTHKNHGIEFNIADKIQFHVFPDIWDAKSGTEQNKLIDEMHQLIRFVLTERWC